MRHEQGASETALEPARETGDASASASSARATFVVCIVAALGFVALFWVRRLRQRRSLANTGETPPLRPALGALRRELEKRPSIVMSCPVCDRDFRDEGGRKYCPFDGSRLAPRPKGGLLRESLVCPECARGYADGERCEIDGEELLPRPLAEVRMASRAKLAEKSTEKSAPGGCSEPKVCPRCGVQTAGPDTFCARDGAALTLLQ
jgi:hypothetical protein